MVLQRAGICLQFQLLLLLSHFSRVRLCMASQSPAWFWASLFFDLIVLWYDFPDGSEGKASAYNAGDLGSIPGLGRSSGEGNGNLLRYSCLENPIDGGASWATVHGVAKSWTWLSDLTSFFFGSPQSWGEQVLDKKENDILDKLIINCRETGF